ncbi:MAG: hypothetical protein ACHQ51_03055 [Elusimicrobiota bacterium]
MNARWSGFARELRDRAAARPWLWAVPAAGLAEAELVGAAHLPGGYLSLILKVVPVLTAALFAEIWAGDGAGIDADRSFEAGVIFFLPYPVLLAATWLLNTFAVGMFVKNMDQASLLKAVDAIRIALSVLAMLALVLSALAFARWKDRSGAWAAFGPGARALALNPVFVILILGATWFSQEVLAFAARHVSLWPVDARGDNLLIDLVWGYLHSTLRLFGCVAAPLLASWSGRLKS